MDRDTFEAVCPPHSPVNEYLTVDKRAQNPWHNLMSKRFVFSLWTQKSVIAYWIRKLQAISSNPKKTRPCWVCEIHKRGISFHDNFNRAQGTLVNSLSCCVRLSFACSRLESVLVGSFQLGVPAKSSAQSWKRIWRSNPKVTNAGSWPAAYACGEDHSVHQWLRCLAAMEVCVCYYDVISTISKHSFAVLPLLPLRGRGKTAQLLC